MKLGTGVAAGRGSGGVGGATGDETYEGCGAASAAPKHSGVVIAGSRKNFGVWNGVAARDHQVAAAHIRYDEVTQSSQPGYVLGNGNDTMEVFEHALQCFQEGALYW